MKSILVSFLLFACTIGYAQVGVNTTNPQSSLDIVASNIDTPLHTDGVLIPRVNNLPTTNPTAAQQGMLLYLSVDRTNINISGTPEDYERGFYYWDHSIPNWVAFISKPSYGEIYSTADAANVSINAPINFPVAGVSHGVTLATNHITTGKAGVYRITYTISIEKDGGGGSEEIEFFLTQGPLNAGGFEVPGTRTYTDTSNDPDYVTVTRAIYLDLPANQSFYVYPDQTNNDVNILSGSSLSVELID